MLSPGAPATSADPSRLARNATPAVRPLRTTPVTERSRGTGPAGLGGANWGASMRGGSRVSSICKTSGRDLGMFISDGSSGAMIGPRACRSFSQELPDGALPAEALPAGPRMPPAGGGVMNCGSRALRPPRGAGGSGSRTLGLGSEGAEPIQHPSHLALFLRPLRPGLTRTPRARTSFVIRRAAKRRPLVLQIVALERLPQSLQFEDQRLALRRRDVLIRPADPVARQLFHRHARDQNPS